MFVFVRCLFYWLAGDNRSNRMEHFSFRVYCVRIDGMYKIGVFMFRCNSVVYICMFLLCGGCFKTEKIRKLNKNTKLIHFVIHFFKGQLLWVLWLSQFFQIINFPICSRFPLISISIRFYQPFLAVRISMYTCIRAFL